MLERGDGVGGTWHYNTYPGCACDVPSNLYSFSFAPNPDWSRTYSRQPEIRAYLERVVDQFGVRPKIRLNTEVLQATWDDDAQRWQLETSAGRLTAQGPGLGHRPAGRAEDPGLPRAREVHRADGALGALGSLARPAREAGGVDRHRRLGDPVRPEGRARRRAALRLPAHAAVDHAALGAAGEADRAARLPALPGRAARGPRRHLRGARADGARLRQAAARDEAARADRRPAPRTRAEGPRADRQDHAAPSRSAASASCRPTTGIPRSRATTSSWSRTAWPKCASARS